MAKSKMGKTEHRQNLPKYQQQQQQQPQQQQELAQHDERAQSEMCSTLETITTSRTSESLKHINVECLKKSSSTASERHGLNNQTFIENEKEKCTQKTTANTDEAKIMMTCGEPNDRFDSQRQTKKVEISEKDESRMNDPRVNGGEESKKLRLISRCQENRPSCDTKREKLEDDKSHPVQIVQSFPKQQHGYIQSLQSHIQQPKPFLNNEQNNQHHHHHLQQPQFLSQQINTLYNNNNQHQQPCNNNVQQQFSGRSHHNNHHQVPITLPAITNSCYIHQPASTLQASTVDFLPSQSQQHPFQITSTTNISQHPQAVGHIPVHFPAIVSNQNSINITPLVHQQPALPQPQPHQASQQLPPASSATTLYNNFDQTNFMCNNGQHPAHTNNILQQMEWQLQVQKHNHIRHQLQQQQQQQQQQRVHQHQTQQQQLAATYQNNIFYHQQQQQPLKQLQQQQQQQQQQQEIHFLQLQQQQNQINQPFVPFNMGAELCVQQDQTNTTITDHFSNNKYNMPLMKQQQQNPQLSQNVQQSQQQRKSALSSQHDNQVTGGNSTQANQGVNLYVKHLEDDVDDGALKKMFSRFGEVVSAKVMMEGQASRGFGFVCFAKAEDAARAMRDIRRKSDDLSMKNLYVAPAQRKEERQAFFREKLRSFMDDTAVHNGNQEETDTNSILVNPTTMNRDRRVDVPIAKHPELLTSSLVMTTAGEKKSATTFPKDITKTTNSTSTTTTATFQQSGQTAVDDVGVKGDALMFGDEGCLSSQTSCSSTHCCRWANRRCNIFDLDNFTLERLTVPLLQPASFSGDVTQDLMSNGQESQAEPIPKWFFEADDDDDIDDGGDNAETSARSEIIRNEGDSHYRVRISNKAGSKFPSSSIRRKANKEHWPLFHFYPKFDFSNTSKGREDSNRELYHMSTASKEALAGENNMELVTLDNQYGKLSNDDFVTNDKWHRNNSSERSWKYCKEDGGGTSRFVGVTVELESDEIMSNRQTDTLEKCGELVADCIACCTDTDSSASAEEDNFERQNTIVSQNIIPNHNNSDDSAQKSKNNSNIDGSFKEKGREVLDLDNISFIVLGIRRRRRDEFDVDAKTNAKGQEKISDEQTLGHCASSVLRPNQRDGLRAQSLELPVGYCQMPGETGKRLSAISMSQSTTDQRGSRKRKREMSLVRGHGMEVMSVPRKKKLVKERQCISIRCSRYNE